MEEGEMDFHGMKRKQLQALCKKHGIPANKSNAEMADLLTLTLKGNENPITNVQSEVPNESDSTNVPKKLKIVKFSPDVEIREYEPSVYKGRKRWSMVNSGKANGPSPRIRSRVRRTVEKDVDEVVLPVVGKKRGRGGEKKGSVGVENVDVSDKSEPHVIVKDGGAQLVKGGDNLSRRQLRGRGVVIEEKAERVEGDLVVSRKNSRLGVSRKRGNREGSDGGALLDEVSVENASAKDDAKPANVPSRGRRNASENDSISLSSVELGETGIVGRISRSCKSEEGTSTVTANKAETFEVLDECNMVLQTEEPLKGVGRYALSRRQLRRRGVVIDENVERVEGDLVISRKNSRQGVSRKRGNSEGSDGSALMDEVSLENASAKDDAKPANVPSRARRNARENDSISLSNVDLGKTGIVGRITRSRKLEEGASSVTVNNAETFEVQDESHKVLHTEEPLKGVGRYALKRKSFVPRKRVASEILTEEGVESGKGNRHSKRNARNKEGTSLLSRNFSKAEVIGRITRSRSKVEENTSSVIANEAETFEIQNECEKILCLEKPLKDLGRYALRRKSIVPRKEVAVESGSEEGLESVKVVRRSTRNVGKATDSNPNVPVAAGRSTRLGAQVVGNACADEATEVNKEHNRTVQLEGFLKAQGRSAERQKSVTVEKGKVESEGPEVNRETSDYKVEASLQSKCEIEEDPVPIGHLRRSRRGTIVLGSTFATDELGIGEAVGKVGRLKRKSKSVHEEDTSAVVGESLVGKPSRQHAQHSSTSDLVRSTVPCETVEKKEQSVPARLVMEEQAISTERNQIEHSGLTMPESSGDKDNFSLNCCQEVFKTSDKKWSDSKTSAMRRTSFLEVSVVCSDFNEGVDTKTNLLETSSPTSTSLMLVSASANQEAPENLGQPVVLDEEPSIVVGVNMKVADDPPCRSVEGGADFGNDNLDELELAEIQTSGFSSSNQSDFSGLEKGLVRKELGEGIRLESGDVNDCSTGVYRTFALEDGVCDPEKTGQNSTNKNEHEEAPSDDAALPATGEEMVSSITETNLQEEGLERKELGESIHLESGDVNGCSTEVDRTFALEDGVCDLEKTGRDITNKNEHEEAPCDGTALPATAEEMVSSSTEPNLQEEGLERKELGESIHLESGDVNGCSTEVDRTFALEDGVCDLEKTGHNITNKNEHGEEPCDEVLPAAGEEMISSSTEINLQEEGDVLLTQPAKEKQKFVSEGNSGDVSQISKGTCINEFLDGVTGIGKQKLFFSAGDSSVGRNIRHHDEKACKDEKHVEDLDAKEAVVDVLPQSSMKEELDRKEDNFAKTTDNCIAEIKGETEVTFHDDSVKALSGVNSPSMLSEKLSGYKVMIARRNCKIDLVGSTVPGKTVEKKQQRISALPVMVDEAIFTEKEQTEHTGLTMAEATGDKYNFSSNCCKGFFKTSDKKGSKIETSETRRPSFLEVSALCSDFQEGVDAKTNMQETSPPTSTSLMLVSASANQETQEHASQPADLNEEANIVVRGMRKLVPDVKVGVDDPSCRLTEDGADIGNDSLDKLELVELQSNAPDALSLACDFSSANESDFAGLEKGLEINELGEGMHLESGDDNDYSTEVDRTSALEDGVCALEKSGQSIATDKNEQEEAPCEDTALPAAGEEMVSWSTKINLQEDGDVLLTQPAKEKQNFVSEGNSVDVSQVYRGTCIQFTGIGKQRLSFSADDSSVSRNIRHHDEKACKDEKHVQDLEEKEAAADALPQPSLKEVQDKKEDNFAKTTDNFIAEITRETEVTYHNDTGKASTGVNNPPMLSEKFSSYKEMIAKSNCKIDATFDVTSSKCGDKVTDMDSGRNMDGEPVVEQCENKEEVVEESGCTVETEHGDDSGCQKVSLKVNAKIDFGLTQLISKGREGSEGKSVDMTINRSNNFHLSSKEVGSCKNMARAQCDDVVRKETAKGSLLFELCDRRSSEVAGNLDGGADESLTPTIYKETEISSEKNLIAELSTGTCGTDAVSELNVFFSPNAGEKYKSHPGSKSIGNDAGGKVTASSDKVTEHILPEVLTGSDTSALFTNGEVNLIQGKTEQDQVEEFDREDNLIRKDSEHTAWENENVEEASFTNQEVNFIQGNGELDEVEESGGEALKDNLISPGSERTALLNKNIEEVLFTNREVNLMLGNGSQDQVEESGVALNDNLIGNSSLDEHAAETSISNNTFDAPCDLRVDNISHPDIQDTCEAGWGAIDKVSSGATAKMNKLEEVGTGGTSKPIIPAEASHETEKDGGFVPQLNCKYTSIHGGEETNREYTNPTEQGELHQDYEVFMAQNAGAQEVREALNDATDDTSLETSPSEQANEHPDAVIESALMHSLDCLTQNPQSCQREGESRILETEASHCLHKPDDGVFSEDILDFGNGIVTSPLKCQTDVDTSAGSSISASQHHIIETDAWELNLFFGENERDDNQTSESDAWFTNLRNEDAGKAEENIVGTEQAAIRVAERQHGEFGDEQSEETKHTFFAISDEPNFEDAEGSKKQDRVPLEVDSVEECINCENHKNKYVNTEHSDGSAEKEILTDVAEVNACPGAVSSDQRVEVEPDSSHLKHDNVDLSVEDIAVTMDLSVDCPSKPDVSMLDQSPEITDSTVGQDIAVGDDRKRQMKLPSPEKTTSCAKEEESCCSDAIQLNTSLAKRKISKTGFVQPTPKKMTCTDMKENQASGKREQHGNMTAPNTFSKRRALENLRNN